MSGESPVRPKDKLPFSSKFALWTLDLVKRRLLRD